MHRSPIVIGATIAGTAGVLAFQASPSTVQAVATATKSTTPASSSSTTGASSAAGGSGASSSSGTSTSASTSTAAPGTASGDAIATRYGDVRVRVTVSKGKITKIQALQLTDSDPKSVQISSSAEPILKQEALSKQSANIDAVSGATYTSAGYAQSLQSALDKLGFKPASGAHATLQVPS